MACCAFLGPPNVISQTAELWEDKLPLNASSMVKVIGYQPVGHAQRALRKLLSYWTRIWECNVILFARRPCAEPFLQTVNAQVTICI